MDLQLRPGLGSPQVPGSDPNPPPPNPMQLRSFLRHRGLMTSLLVILIGTSIWLNWPRPTLVDLPRLNAQALSSAAQRGEFDRRYLALLPKAQITRLAYIHKHAEAIARP